MNNKILLLALLLGGSLFSCKDDTSVPMSDLIISVTAPDGISSLEGITLEVYNVNSGTTDTATTDASGEVTLTLQESVYNITATGEAQLSVTTSDETDENDTVNDGGTVFYKEVTLTGLLENQSISGDAQEVTVELSISIESKGWVFKELYFTGSRTPEDKAYYKDKYFEIYNNTDSILYADGISLVETKHITTNEENDWDAVVDIDEATVAGVIYTIPGEGSDYPVQPGASMVLCDLAIDHTEENSNSFDLSDADFEWYDEGTTDVDVPEVTNLTKNFSYSKTIWTPNNRGYKSYLIFKQDGTMEDFLADNKVEISKASGSSTITGYKIPNDYVLDAVEVSTPSKFASKAFSSSLDLSYTHCGDGDDSRYAKCVRRKVLKTVDGRVVYQDTNNSASDFETTVTPQPKVYE